MFWEKEIQARGAWIDHILTAAKAKGVVLGLSGGKDSAIVAALVLRATPHLLGVIMPCGGQNADCADAQAFAASLGFPSLLVDLEPTYQILANSIVDTEEQLSAIAAANLKPRLRMTTLYAIAQSRGYLVAGTSNRSERVMGYFTKWGDGVSDFNPIADLTVREVLQLGEALGVPHHILYKTPSAGLWPGQTDEEELGISYQAIDAFLLEGKGSPEDIAKIQQAAAQTEHKRGAIPFYRLLNL
ncbi:MAG: NAD(+) synthase [Symbiobacteriaceae bacterium]|nr:NAD(+) synthase [Symbiobacteriaceae bacterium]